MMNGSLIDRNAVRDWWEEDFAVTQDSVMDMLILINELYEVMLVVKIVNKTVFLKKKKIRW